jgi:CheY-like chemotaxis protein/glycine cleavage system H lipoate-binding protein/Ni,Fe-hydrogenase maturation factor
MPEVRKLLVVDDEPTVCRACGRIFSRQGFEVEESTDPREGLDWATQRDYSGILLDVKMPMMDGIQFLQRLRETKPEVPVLIMTGYPSVPNAAAAIRLGASDYVTKPFTPEEITQAMRRTLSRRTSGGPLAESVRADGSAREPEGLLFLDESWLQLESDGSACVGAVLPGLRGASIESIRLPKVGEVVYQGLPLAGVKVADRQMVVVRSPLSGVVAAVNDRLVSDPAALTVDPCGQGWIACVCTTRLEDEMTGCRRRQVILVNADDASAEDQRARLALLGCGVSPVRGREDLAGALRATDAVLLLIDAASFGERGPALVAQVNSLAPSMRVVVVACPEGHWEGAYRKQRIFYYAMEPFEDNEMADILDAAFRVSDPQHQPPARAAKGAADSIGSISVTNRNGRKVQLLAGPGLLWRTEGLGAEIGRRLAERSLPAAVASGEAGTSAPEILKAAARCDRLMVLRARDADRLPGSLSREVGGEVGEAAARVTTLLVESDSIGGFTGLDARTISALAEHIVREMASY